MIKVDLAKWDQTVEDLRVASLNDPHPRSRERFQALYLIASGRYNATTCATHIGRQDETVLHWVHLYNQHGPDAVASRHTGGRSPLLPRNRRNRSSTPWPTRTRRTTACRVTMGPSRSSSSGHFRRSACRPGATPSDASCVGPT